MAALQRLADSLQVLVLVLPTDQTRADPRSLLVAAAARQALDDVVRLQGCLVHASQDRQAIP